MYASRSGRFARATARSGVCASVRVARPVRLGAAVSVRPTQVRTIFDDENPFTTEFFKKRTLAPATIPGTSGAVASMLYEEAFAKGGASEVTNLEKMLFLFVSKLEADESLIAMLNSPFLEKEERHAYVSELVSSIGATKFFAQLMNAVVDLGHAARFSQIGQDYEEIMRAHRREVDVTLTVGRALSPAEIEQYKRSIANDYLKPGDNVVFNVEVQSGLVGYQVKVAGQIHDFSQNDVVSDIILDLSQNISERIESLRTLLPRSTLSFDDFAATLPATVYPDTELFRKFFPAPLESGLRPAAPIMGSITPTLSFSSA